jgi:hypothetical protein
MSAPTSIFDPKTIPLGDEYELRELVDRLIAAPNCFRCGQLWGMSDADGFSARQRVCKGCYITATTQSIAIRLRDWGRAEQSLQRTYEVVDRPRKRTVVTEPAPVAPKPAPVVPKPTLPVNNPEPKRCPRPVCKGNELEKQYNGEYWCSACDIRWADSSLRNYRINPASVEAQIAEMFRAKAAAAKVSKTDPVIGNDNSLLGFEPDLSNVKYYRSPDFPDYVVSSDGHVYRFTDRKRSKSGQPIRLTFKKNGAAYYRLYRGTGSPKYARPDFLLANAMKSTKFSRNG